MYKKNKLFYDYAHKRFIFWDANIYTFGRQINDLRHGFFKYFFNVIFLIF